MAQTGYTPISIYYSATATNTPTAGNLVAGELAINTADGKLFYKDSSGVVQVLGTKGGVGSSSTTQVLYNSSGLVVGSANMTFSGTALTLANDASISGLTVGKGTNGVTANTALGSGALLGANSGSGNNTAIGYQSSYSNTSGSYNTSVGQGSLYTNTTGLLNVALGQASLYYNTTGGYNVAVGPSALSSNTTASNNTAVGYQALYSNTTNGQNTAIGTQALYSTISPYNTAVGWQAGYSNSGGSITAVGMYALKSNTSGYANVAVGGYDANLGIAAALQSNTTGTYNTAMGVGALQANTTATNNIAIGYQSLYANTTGASNVVLGSYAGGGVTTGNNNVCVGYGAGLYSTVLTTGGQNLYVGTNAGASSASVSYEMVIACLNSIGKGSSTGYINPQGGGVYQGNNSTLWSITSDQRLKKNIVDNNDGLNKITQIKVRNFEYRTADEVTELPKSSAIDIQGVQLGAIAQELIEVLPDCVKTESTGVMSVDASNITWHLINAVKELNAKVIALEAKLGA